MDAAMHKAPHGKGVGRHLGIDLSKYAAYTRPMPVARTRRTGSATHRMPATADTIDQVFRALADPTRRRVVERLSRSPASVGELAARFDMALSSFVQHMRVLEDCGLVSSRKSGRIRTFQLAPRRLKVAEHWLDRQRSLWDRRFDQLDELLIDLKESRP